VSRRTRYLGRTMPDAEDEVEASASAWIGAASQKEWPSTELIDFPLSTDERENGSA